MNSTVYLFGVLGGGYTQYPDDYSREIFSEFEKNIKSPAQLMIRRSDALIYYAYLRKLSEQGKYIGIAFVFNGAMCADHQSLCKLCEENITNWVVNGDILEFTDNGDITSKIDKLYKTATEFKRISESLSTQIESSNLPFQKLPPVNYSISSHVVKKFNINDSYETINDALKDYSNIYIYSDSTSETLTGYSEKLRSLNRENIRLRDENTKALREKKRTTIVTVLSLILAVGVITIISFANRASEQDKQIKRLRYDKEQLTEHVGALQKDSIYFVGELDKSQKLLQSREKHIKRLQNDSIIIENTNYNLRTDLDIANNKIKAYQQTIDKKDSELKEKDRIISGLCGQVNASGTTSQSVSNTILINTVKIASVKKNGWQTNNDFGKSISSYNSYYLKVKVEYRTGVKDKYMSIKLFGPSKNGYGSDLYSLITEKVPPVTKGSSFAQYMFNDKLGNHDQQLPAGYYRIEFWYNGEKIKEHTFWIK